MVETVLENVGIFKDWEDETIKNVFRKPENNEILEMTLVQNKADIDVFCAPSHHFCSLGCKMCHLTNKNLKKRMITVDYAAFFEALVKTAYKNNYYPAKAVEHLSIRRTQKRDCLLSFMGVGEPLLNLQLLRDIFLNEKQLKAALGYENIGYAISTIFPHKNMEELYRLVDLGMPLKVHFSLHSPLSEERKALLPGTSVSVEEALSLLCDYRSYITANTKVMDEFSKLHRVLDPVEIHYTLIRGINDSDVHLDELIRLLKEYPIQLKFILFNPIGGMERSPNLDKWMEHIRKSVPEINVVAYEPPGRGVGSSCGEFTKHYYHYEIESEEEYKEFLCWEKEHAFYE